MRHDEKRAREAEELAPSEEEIVVAGDIRGRDTTFKPWPGILVRMRFSSGDKTSKINKKREQQRREIKRKH